MREFETLKRDVRQELRERLSGEGWTNAPHDIIHEIADSNVPVYNHDILKMASEEYDLSLAEPELGPAFDGTPTPVNIIAANIFEALEAECWEEHKAMSDRREESEVWYARNESIYL